MLLFLTKLLPSFVYPLGAAIILGLLALALLLTGRAKAGRSLVAILLLVLWIPSTPWFANRLSLWLELQYPPSSIDALPQRETIILLGGILRQPVPPRLSPDLNDAADRVMQALRLYRAGRASVIVVTGGNLPWIAQLRPEAELLADLLVELGVPRTALVIEDAGRNTHESGINVAALFKQRGWRNGLLVTSGIHMPRALAVFRHAGIDVTPAATDISGTLGGRVLGALPDVQALSQSTGAIKEVIGLWAYRWLGWA